MARLRALEPRDEASARKRQLQSQGDQEFSHDGIQGAPDTFIDARTGPTEKNSAKPTHQKAEVTKAVATAATNSPVGASCGIITTNRLP